MMQIYRRMLDRLVAADWQDPLWLPRSRRLVGRFEKVAIGLRYGLFAVSSDHVIGAGVAGLSAALRIAEIGAFGHRA